MSATPPTSDPIGILVAVREELRAILRKMPSADVESADGISFYRGWMGGKAVVAAKSGMGMKRAERAARLLIARYKPGFLIVAGFGAGLAEGVAPGDLVIADAVYDLESRTSLHPDRIALERARSIRFQGGAIRVVGLLTSPTLAASAREKIEMASLAPGLKALDMETASAARIADDSGVPWMAVRAITDGVRDSLPVDFSSFVDSRNGEVAPRRLAVYALTHPWAVPGFVRLGARAGRAARNLAAFVEAYVGALPIDS